MGEENKNWFARHRTAVFGIAVAVLILNLVVLVVVPTQTPVELSQTVTEYALDDGTESVFGPGTVLQVTGTDGKSFVDVITSDGVTGRIAIEQPAGDWQWYIDGESELEYFELVPYVG